MFIDNTLSYHSLLTNCCCLILFRVQNQARGTLDVLYDGEPKGTAFDNLPTSEPLYFMSRVCGHTGAPRMRIIDEITDFDSLVGVENENSAEH